MCLRLAVTNCKCLYHLPGFVSAAFLIFSNGHSFILLLEYHLVTPSFLQYSFFFLRRMKSWDCSSFPAVLSFSLLFNQEGEALSFLFCAINPFLVGALAPYGKWNLNVDWHRVSHLFLFVAHWPQGSEAFVITQHLQHRPPEIYVNVFSKTENQFAFKVM